MKKIDYSFKKVFLDSMYSETFTELCIKGGTIHHDIFGQDVHSDGTPLKGKIKLLQAMVLFENIDCSPTVYDYKELIDRGLISENSICCSNTETTSVFESQAVSIMSAYKKEITRHIQREYKEKLNWLQTEKVPSHDFWRTIPYNRRDVYQVYITDNFNADLDQDYYTLINNLDQLDSLVGGEKAFLKHLLGFDQINTLISIRNNIAYSLMSSEKGNTSYMNGILLGGNQLSSYTPAESTYAFFKTRLPDEVNILPMPFSIQDVWRMRQHPAKTAFRKVISEWDYYINQGDIAAAERIKKDIIKANHYLEKLDSFKKCVNSPYVRTGFFAAGFVPLLSNIVNVISFLEPFISNALLKKHSWTHIN